jgi:two-component system, NarL family, sensor histidine kinase FusK
MRARLAPVTARRWFMRHIRYILTSLAIISLYVVAAKLGLSLAYTTKQVTTVWPPSGIALAALLMFGVRYFPSVFLGALIANALTQEALLVAVGIAIGNTLEALVGNALLRRVFGFHKSFRAPRDVLVFGIAATLCTLVAASWGPLILASGGLIKMHNYWSVAATWWQGDLLGVLLFAPLIITYMDRRARREILSRWVEAVLLTILLGVASIVVFGELGHDSISYPYLLFPFLIWAAVRLTPIGAATGAVIIATIAVWFTVNGQGPFAGVIPLEEGLVDLQVYVIMLAATSLTIALVITAREAVEQELRERDLQLQEANKRITEILAGILDGNSPRRKK